MNGILGLNGVGDNIENSKPYIAYDRTNNIINSPATSVSCYTNGHTSTYNSFGVGSHTGGGNRMYVQTKNILDGSNYIPTQGCKKVTFRIFIGSTSYYARSAWQYLYGKKKDGTIVQIASKWSNVGSTLNTNSTWSASYDVSEYESIRLYGNMTWGDDANSWISAFINYIELHD